MFYLPEVSADRSGYFCKRFSFIRINKTTQDPLSTDFQDRRFVLQLTMSRPTRRIRPVERQPMKEWLLEHLDSEELPGLMWVDRSRGIFKIMWCHGSRHGWSTKDINVFEQWAKHTGRHYHGKERDPKRWKANFRCALNSLKTVVQVDKTLKGQNAYREYAFVDWAKRMKVEYGNNGTKRKPSCTVKREISEEDEAYMQHDPSDTEESSIKIEQTEEETGQILLSKPFKVPDSSLILPVFNKISPGIIPEFEYGKHHTMKNHFCGFTVTQLEQNHIQLQSQTSVESNYHYPETPEDSVPTDTETDVDMYAQTIEIVTTDDTDEETEGQGDNIGSPDGRNYEDHFPLTPPGDVVICVTLPTNGNQQQDYQHSPPKIPTFITDYNKSINYN